MTYKFRAECRHDVILLMVNTNVLAKDEWYLKRMDPATPDVEVTFDSDLSLEEIIKEMKEFQDTHVMIETVALANEYTGIRKLRL